jgi:single-strand DNA-binding protein
MAFAAVLTGNVTRDPEYREAQNGNNFVRFSVASNFFANGENKVDYYNVKAWGNDADFVNAHVKKGSAVIVLGWLETETYEKDGETKSVQVLKASSIKFAQSGGKRKNGEESDESDDKPAPKSGGRKGGTAAKKEAPKPRPRPNFAESDEDDDSVPF